MATTVIMPKLGNSVESTIIVAWKKAVGDTVAEDDILCEVETDKAVMEVPSTVSGTLLAILHEANEEVPVLANIAVIGAPGDDISQWTASAAPSPRAPADSVPAAPAQPVAGAAVATLPAAAGDDAGAGGPISPRARKLAAHQQIDTTLLAGSGPGGRIIERDVVAAMAAQPKLTPVARAMVDSGDFAVPTQGSGPRGRVMKQDLLAKAGAAPDAQGAPFTAGNDVGAAETTGATAADEVETIPVRGVRKVIAERMLASLQTTAQLTLNASADARALQALRARFKSSPEDFGLRGITINDLLLFAVSRALPLHPELNALFQEGVIQRHRAVHLGMAVDTARGLLVPVIRQAQNLSLSQLAAEAKRLAGAALESKAKPDELVGATFTVTNLGAFGVESFTPVLNPPQVAILGVSNIQLKPVAGADGEVEFVPHIGLSLTINHQVVDGAPAARFLQTLARQLADVDLLLAR